MKVKKNLSAKMEDTLVADGMEVQEDGEAIDYQSKNNLKLFTIEPFMNLFSSPVN